MEACADRSRRRSGAGGRWQQTGGVSCCGPGCWTCSLVVGTQWATVRLKNTDEHRRLPLLSMCKLPGFKRCHWLLTVQEVALGFQDLHHVVDPGPAGLSGGGLQLETHHAPVGVAGRQHEAGVVSVRAGLHPQTAHLEQHASG